MRDRLQRWVHWYASQRFLSLVLVALVGCAGGGAPAGAACVRASQCASGHCLFLSDGGVCAQPCRSSVDCSGNAVCGRFDFRGFDLDSGLRAGAETDIVRVCRPPLNAPCGAGLPCANGASVCLGEPGVCTSVCESDLVCPSRRCLFTGSCGASGRCAPLCDDVSECPRGFFCNLAIVDVVGHGRCEPVSVDVDGGFCDAATD